MFGVSEVTTYWYEGYCPTSGRLLRLPRTQQAEAIAHDLMEELKLDRHYAQEGKMYGILLVEASHGEQHVLKAFSGLLNGERDVEGWVPSISEGRDSLALEETQTLADLETLKNQLIQLQQIPERQQYQSLSQKFEIELKELAQHHQQRKRDRQLQRQHFIQTLKDEALQSALMQLDRQSQLDGIERRNLKRDRDTLLHPLKQQIEQADAEICRLKQQRKALSQTLQAQLHKAYRLTNFAGESRSIAHLITAAPTGTGECCAPKLLHYAATHQFKPLAMAEFWWGENSGDKIQGKFYGACVDRCQPLMGFLLSGLPLTSSEPLSIVYEDDWMIVVHKPSGLLSVPGRYRHTQDSVLSRLAADKPLWAVHRLDQDTSGLLILARDRSTYRELNRQFQQRRVHKVYEAVLAERIAQREGTIELPLWSDPHDRPIQKIDWQRGKPSITHYRMMNQDLTRVEFTPITGRTHQIRVHAADSQGLGVAILGDRLYGDRANHDRLHLHAREISFEHPQSKQILHLKTETPF